MADNNLSESSYRSRYGIEKLRDHTYYTWSFQCRMLLSEKKVWYIVNGKITRPQAVEDYPAEEQATLRDADKRRILKEITEWDEKNEEALRVISFTVTDRLQGPIHYRVTAKGAWDELRKVHAPNDKQRKYSLIKRLYRLDMQIGSSLMGHESIFDDLV